MSREDDIPVLAQYLVKQERKPVKLGLAIEELFNTQLKPRYRQCERIEEIWNEIIDESLAGHCRCGGIKAGVVEVKVDSPVYSYQLSLVSGTLLERIREMAPGLKVKKIKVVLG